jgi:T5SS/PEP-CTERM-associated repeat protein
MKKIIKYLLFSAGAFALFNSAALAQCFQTTTWIDGSDSWFTATNWNNGVPVSTKAAQINNGGTAQIALLGGSACTLTLGAGAADSGKLTVGGTSDQRGSLSVSNSVLVGAAGTGTVTVANWGSISSKDLTVAQQWFPPSVWSHGTVTIDGSNANWTVNGQVNVGGTATSRGGSGTLALKNDGSVNAGGVVIGIGGTLTGRGTIVVGSSGVTIAGTLAPNVTPTTADTVNVQGHVTLTNSLAGVAVTFANGNYTVGTQYTLLTASSGVTGTFSNVSFINQPANVCPGITYDTNHVYLILQPHCTD